MGLQFSLGSGGGGSGIVSENEQFILVANTTPLGQARTIDYVNGEIIATDNGPASTYVIGVGVNIPKLNGQNNFTGSNWFGGSTANVFGKLTVGSSSAGKITLTDTDNSNVLAIEAPNDITSNYTNRFPGCFWLWFYSEHGRKWC
jgi:hypothetical protein